MYFSLSLNISWFFFLVSILSTTSQSNFEHLSTNPNKTHPVISYYEEGLKERENGNIEKSLAIWEEALTESEVQDFRISYSYIEVVVQEKLRSKYQKASEIYFWGLTGSLESFENEFFLAELATIRPLVGEGNYKDLKKLLDNNNPGIFESIQNIWADFDPTPLSEYNERLLEHWERIIYARQNFMKPNGEELDDRAYLYLKFGEPFYTKKGQLNYSSALVNRLLKEGIQPPSFASNEQMAITSTQRMNLENRVRQYHSYPRFEVWMYNNLSAGDENTIFMFGTRDGLSSFRKITSIEDFIPSEAYRIPEQHNYSFTTRNATQEQGEGTDESIGFNSSGSAGGTPKVNITPALILQLMYYEQFAALDEYFGKAYNNMMDRFVNVSNIGGNSMKGLAREFGTLYGNKLITIQNNAPDESSTYETNLIDLPSKYYSYRFLDDKKEPYIKLFAITDIEEAAYYDILKSTNSLQTEISNRYRLTSGYQVKNESNENLYQGDSTDPVQSLSSVVNTFSIPHISSAKSVHTSHELHSVETEGTPAVSESSPFPESLLGLSNHTMEFPEPLVNEGLVVSDFIIGYSASGQEEQIDIPRDSISFSIAHTRVIPQGSELNLYYELYNLSTEGADGFAEYRFEYSITKKRRGLFARNTDPLITIDINNTVEDETDKNVIIIDTSSQEQGTYQLSINITDINSGLSVSRQEEFTIE